MVPEMNMENSRKRIQKTLEFDNPSQIAYDLWVLPWASYNYAAQLKDIQERFPSDIACSPAFLKQKPDTQGNPFEIGEFTDEWGCTFFNIHRGIIGEVKHPQVASYDVKINVPRASLSVDKNQVNAFCKKTDKFVLADCCPRPFERMQFLRGTENLMMDIALDSPQFIDMLNKVHNFFLDELEVWAQTDVDALKFMDDWGSQNSLLIRPDTWRRYFKPLYKQYADIAKQHNKYLFMHSDGFITDIIPDLIEIGVNALNSQIFCMGPRELGDRFKRKITFWGELDRQWILPHGSESDVTKAANEMRQYLYDHGGLIAQCEFGPGAKPENISTFFQTMSRL